MLQVDIIQIAATKNKHLSALEEEFEKRLKPFMKLNTYTLKASKSDEREKVQSEEKSLLLSKINPKAFVIALDERGIEHNSEVFAKCIEKTRDFRSGHIQFLIGGSHGLHPDLHKESDLMLALSKMTFTHEMVRVFLKEQLYRAMMILAGRTYHK